MTACEIEHSVETDASQTVAWRFWANVSNWSDPPAEFELDGPFAVGSRGTTRMPGQPPMHWTIRDVQRPTRPPSKARSTEQSSCADGDLKQLPMDELASPSGWSCRVRTLRLTCRRSTPLFGQTLRRECRRSPPRWRTMRENGGQADERRRVEMSLDAAGKSAGKSAHATQ